MAAAAQTHNTCPVVQVDMTPVDDLQIVVWLEDAAGTFVDTMFITRLTGSFGLGNRPGRYDFNSAWRWPYGRRTVTFPVWAHRHGQEWPLVVFQNDDDDNLSHPLSQSSREQFFCRPLREGESQWDTETCSSMVYTDKGVLSATETSNYPPRRDLTFVAGTDSESVNSFRQLNPFDAVSRPTPVGNEPFQLVWPIPDGIPAGDYVLWVEVAKEFDQNSFYAFPSPSGIPWSEYGLPFRGQPSVVYRVPFTLGTTEFIARSTSYDGYGDPDGIDGDVRIPDVTITTGVDGSGASRLLLGFDGSEMYRVRVRSYPSDDKDNPGATEELTILDAGDVTVRGTFVAPGDDGMEGIVTGYEVRYLVAEPLTEASWATANPATTTLGPDEPGQVQEFTVSELTPRTTYSLGIRAYDECRNLGPLRVVEVATTERKSGEVGWCFVATAAYGSVLEEDIEMLRRFRDRYLRSHATGELLVEGYYTFGPALARVIESSDTLRRAARAGLAPIVEAVRQTSRDE